MEIKYLKNYKRQCGFTLLEVIIAMTITGLVLGTVFSLFAGSKRLAFSALDEIDRTIFMRAAINVTQIEEEPEYPEYPKEFAESFELNVNEPLERPKRQTRKLLYVLESYELKAGRKKNQEPVSLLRWKKLEKMPD
ncbi:MAG: type II secretion system protein [Gammaproteobacteria bacterium]|nr:type II secretion system protein [Gammaproteobacteria bacterium]